MLEEIEVLTCPFCGYDVVEIEESSSGYSAICYACLCEGPLGDTEQEAAELWNRRA